MLLWLQTNWGNLVSLAGLIVSIIGFWYTLIQVRESRKASTEAKQAAENAEQAAQAAKESVFALNAITELTAAITILEYIKELQQNGTWPSVPGRISAVCRILSSTVSMSTHVSKEDKEILGGALLQLRGLEKKVATAVHQNTGFEPVKWNVLISKQADKLQEILGSIKQQKT